MAQVRLLRATAAGALHLDFSAAILFAVVWKEVDRAFLIAWGWPLSRSCCSFHRTYLRKPRTDAETVGWFIRQLHELQLHRIHELIGKAHFVVAKLTDRARAKSFALAPISLNESIDTSTTTDPKPPR